MKHHRSTFTILECDFCPSAAIKLRTGDLGKAVADAIKTGWVIIGSHHLPLIKRQMACPDCKRERRL